MEPISIGTYAKLCYQKEGYVSREICHKKLRHAKARFQLDNLSE